MDTDNNYLDRLKQEITELNDKTSKLTLALTQDFATTTQKDLMIKQLKKMHEYLYILIERYNYDKLLKLL